MKDKPIVYIKQTLELRKPIRQNGTAKYADILVYMAKTTSPANRNFNAVWNLASFAIQNDLSGAQMRLADKLIEEYEINNPNVFSDPQVAGEWL